MILRYLTGKEKSIMRGKGSERHGDHVKFHESPTIYDYDRMARAQRRHDDDVYHRYKGQNELVTTVQHSCYFQS